MGLWRYLPSEPSFKPIASYPSDATGNPVSDGDVNPSSWTAYGSAVRLDTDQRVTACAVCYDKDTTVSVQVTRVDADEPGDQRQTLLRPHPPSLRHLGDRLLGGGVLADQGAQCPTPSGGTPTRQLPPSLTPRAPPPSMQPSNPTFMAGVVQAGEGRNTARRPGPSLRPVRPTERDPNARDNPHGRGYPDARGHPHAGGHSRAKLDAIAFADTGGTATTTTLYVLRVPLPSGWVAWWCRSLLCHRVTRQEPSSSKTAIPASGARSPLPTVLLSVHLRAYPLARIRSQQSLPPPTWRRFVINVEVQRLQLLRGIRGAFTPCAPLTTFDF